MNDTASLHSSIGHSSEWSRRWRDWEITARHPAARAVDAYIERWPGLGGMMTITPERIVSWDTGY